jgi:hypothetical protein
MNGGQIEPRVLVIGGHSRNIGKTALVVDLIRAFPEAAWTAVKITQYGHGICANNVEGCGCAPGEHTVALDAEFERSNHTDTSRFLVAGAAHSLWLRAKSGRLAEAMPLLRERLAGAGNVILESNTVLQFLRPALYLVVLDPAQEDFKPSAQMALDRASAFVLRSPFEGSSWRGISFRFFEGKPKFLQSLGTPLPGGLADLVRERFFASAPGRKGHLKSLFC